MAQWVSTTRKTLNHYQSHKQSNLYLNKSDGVISLLIINNTRVIITPMGYKIPGAIEIEPNKTYKSYFNFNNMKPYKNECLNYNNKNVYIGIYDYDTYEPIPLPYTFDSNKDYHYIIGVDNPITLKASSDPIYLDTIIPKIHRIPIVFAWCNKGFENILPSWINSLEPSGDFEPLLNDPTADYTNKQEFLNRASDGLYFSTRLKPELFTNKLLIPGVKATDNIKKYFTYVESGSLSLGAFSGNYNTSSIEEIESNTVVEGIGEIINSATFGSTSNNILFGDTFQPVNIFSKLPEGSLYEAVYPESKIIQPEINTLGFSNVYSKRFYNENNVVGGIFFSIVNNIESIRIENTLFGNKI